MYWYQVLTFDDRLPLVGVVRINRIFGKAKCFKSRARSTFIIIIIKNVLI